MLSYAIPDVLVETAWVAEHTDDPRVRLVECDQDMLLYHTGHIPGAVKLDWLTDLSDPVTRDLVDTERFAQAMAERGIGNDTTIVFYGDTYNWWATYAFWVCKLFGHADARIMNGGRTTWLVEGRPLTRESPISTMSTYQASPRADTRFRALRDQIHNQIGQPESILVDIRSPEEYRGESLATSTQPGTNTLRRGHIPTAVNIPWTALFNEDSTFKRSEEFAQIYHSRGVTPDKDIICYCLLGILSRHTWFVLTYLLGYPRVRNYDGSWSEWGNLVRAPIVAGDG